MGCPFLAQHVVQCSNWNVVKHLAALAAKDLVPQQFFS